MNTIREIRTIAICVALASPASLARGPATAPEISSPQTKRCSIHSAFVNLETEELVLEGRFCGEPVVSIGASGGDLAPLEIVRSGPTFIDASLAPWTDTATRVVVVGCPGPSCAIDVTIGNAGPVGPQGPPGPEGAQGPPGVLPQGLTSPVIPSIHRAYGTIGGPTASCVQSVCLPGQIATGGGYWFPYVTTESPRIVRSGPADSLDWLGVPPPIMPPTDRWRVCGIGAEGHVIVYAMCVDAIPTICGDGAVVGSESCESDADCSAYGSDSTCVDCRCTNVPICGDGVVTFPEECDPPGWTGDGIGGLICESDCTSCDGIGCGDWDGCWGSDCGGGDG